jgi:hypothetical protein
VSDVKKKYSVGIVWVIFASFPLPVGHVSPFGGFASVTYNLPSRTYCTASRLLFKCRRARISPM